ncbi:hypothetical protein INT44_007280, partial [Umbelopsis vinacea]
FNSSHSGAWAAQTSINQSNGVKGVQTASLIKVALGNDTISLVFRDNDKMAKFVDEIRNRIRLSDTHHFQQRSHFSWLTYTDRNASATPVSGSSASNYLKRSNTDSIAESRTSKSSIDDDTLPYTALLQRSGTMRSTKLEMDLRRRVRGLARHKVSEDCTSFVAAPYSNKFVSDRRSVFAGTWNVHGSTPDESLAPWLLGNATENEKAIEPDIYIIGLQEMDLSTEAYLWTDATRENAWCDAVLNGLGNRAQKYRKACRVSTTCFDGNKGCVSVRFRLFDSYVCALGSHLAAFMNQTEKRNLDYAEICKRIVFPNAPDEETAYATSLWNDGGDEGVQFIENSNVVRNWNMQNSIFHSDHLIWVGDLNYRINLTEAEVKAALQRRDLKLLSEYDQLNIERGSGRTFHVFDEGEIDFLPTYKYDAGTNRYDTSEKRRAPAWTDRVLWRKARVHLEPHAESGHHSDIQLTSYSSCMDMMMSDHKPVNAIMNLKARKIDTEKQAQTKAAIVKLVSEHKDDRGPDGRISSSFVDFGDVRFMTQKEVSITLENTGQLVASWHFIPKLDETVICKPWLQISRVTGVLGPGEQTVIDFRILIDATTASTFNNDEDDIDDKLILRLENGKDFFLIISGKYIPTCFGMTLEKLARMKYPVHSPENDRSQRSSRSPSPESSQNGSMPKEIWRMLTFLWNKSTLQLDGLFLESGNLLLAQYITKCLDTGDNFDSSILMGLNEDDDDEEPTTSSPQLDTPKTDQTHLLRRQSREEEEAISSLKHTDEAPNTLEEHTAKINITDDDDENEEVNEAVNPTIGANSMVDVLIAFLRFLPDPVIPATLYKRLLDGTVSRNVDQLIEHMSPVHHSVLLYVVNFLRDAIKHSPEDCVEERTSKIVDTFATALMRPPVNYSDRNPRLTQQKQQQVMKSLLA